MVWDCEKNCEIETIYGPMQFSEPETYTQMGIDININDRQNVKITETKNIKGNNEHSLFIKPVVQNVHFDGLTLFRQFTNIDLWEVHHQKSMAEDVLPEHIDPEFALFDAYGETYFQAMLERQDFSNLINQTIQDSKLEGFTDSCGIDHDNILIRRLFYIL